MLLDSMYHTFSRERNDDGIDMKSIFDTNKERAYVGKDENKRSLS